MKTSELIQKLQEWMRAYGDRVVLMDPNLTGVGTNISSIMRCPAFDDHHGKQPECFLLVSRV